MPELNTAVKEDGSEETSPTVPAAVDTATTDTSTDDVSSQLDDSDFDDIDNSNALSLKDIEDTGDSDDDEDEDKPDKPAEPSVAAQQPKTDETKAATDRQETPADPKPHGKEAREAQLREEIKTLKQEMGIEPNTDIRSLVAERNTLRQLQEAQIRKAGIDLERQLLNMTNPDTGEAYTPDEANRIARSATVEAENTVASQEAYDLTVQRNQTTIERETLQAMQDFPIFMEKLPDGTDNPDYDQELAELAGQHLMDAFILEDSGKKDAEDNPIPIIVNIKRSPYQIMKSVADQAARLRTQREADKAEAEATAAANIAKQASTADVPVNGNTASTRVDTTGQDFDDAFDADY